MNAVEARSQIKRLGTAAYHRCGKMMMDPPLPIEIAEPLEWEQAVRDGAAFALAEAAVRISKSTDPVGTVMRLAEELAAKG